MIDLDKYHRLLDKKEHLDRQEKKLKEQLEASVIKNENSLENIQTGSGTEEDSKKPLHRPDMGFKVIFSRFTWSRKT